MSYLTVSQDFEGYECPAYEAVGQSATDVQEDYENNESLVDTVQMKDSNEELKDYNICSDVKEEINDSNIYCDVNNLVTVSSVPVSNSSNPADISSVSVSKPSASPFTSVKNKIKTYIASLPLFCIGHHNYCDLLIVIFIISTAVGFASVLKFKSDLKLAQNKLAEKQPMPDFEAVTAITPDNNEAID